MLGPLETVWTPHIGRDVYLRPDTSDRQVWADTFSGLYHLPDNHLSLDPRTVLDVGANIGLTAAHYRAIWPAATVAAVEMDDESAELAERNAPDVAIWNHAVFATGGFGSYRRDGVRAEAYAFEPVPETDGRVWTAAATLKDTIRRAFPTLGCADFVKLDVEGAEWGILETARDWIAHAGYVLVELHPDGGRPNDDDALVGEALALLRQAGYFADRHRAHPRAVWAVR